MLGVLPAWKCLCCTGACCHEGSQLWLCCQRWFPAALGSWCCWQGQRWAPRQAHGSMPGCSLPLNLLLLHKPGRIWSPCRHLFLKIPLFPEEIFKSLIFQPVPVDILAAACTDSVFNFLMSRGRASICEVLLLLSGGSMLTFLGSGPSLEFAAVCDLLFQETGLIQRMGCWDDVFPLVAFLDF